MEKPIVGERANLKEKTINPERAIFFMGGKKKADENGRLLTRKGMFG